MMKTRFGSAVFLAIASVTTILLAQSNPVQQPPQPPTTQAPPTAAPSPPTQAPASQDKDRQVTLTGCLENAPAPPAGTSGTSAPESVKRLVLTNALSAAESTAKTVTAPGAGRTYQVIANEAALSPYVGKKVELTGVVEVPVPPAASSSPVPGAEGVPAGTMLPRLRVESGKALPTSCAS